MALEAVVLVLLVPGVVFARRNLRTGRADRRGAARLAIFVFVVMCLGLVLASGTIP